MGSVLCRLQPASNQTDKQCLNLAAPVKHAPAGPSPLVPSYCIAQTDASTEASSVGMIGSFSDTTSANAAPKWQIDKQMRINAFRPAHAAQEKHVPGMVGQIYQVGPKSSEAIWDVKFDACVSTETSSEKPWSEESQVLCSPTFCFSGAAGAEQPSWRCVISSREAGGAVGLQLQNIDSFENSTLAWTCSFHIALRIQAASHPPSFAVPVEQLFHKGASSCFVGSLEDLLRHIKDVPSWQSIQGLRVVVSLRQCVRAVGPSKWEERDLQLPKHVPRGLSNCFTAITVSESPRVVMVENFLPPWLCEAIMSMSASRLMRSKVSSGSETPSRTSWSCFYTGDNARHPNILEVEDRIQCLLSHPEVLGGHQALFKTEALQVVKYHKDEFYAEHYDNKAGCNITRAVTIIIYLNDVAKGGSTYFPRSAGIPRHPPLVSVPNGGILPSGEAGGDDDGNGGAGLIASCQDAVSAVGRELANRGDAKADVATVNTAGQAKSGAAIPDGQGIGKGTGLVGDGNTAVGNGKVDAAAVGNRDASRVGSSPVAHGQNVWHGQNGQNGPTGQTAHSCSSPFANGGGTVPNAPATAQNTLGMVETDCGQAKSSSNLLGMVCGVNGTAAQSKLAGTTQQGVTATDVHSSKAMDQANGGNASRPAAPSAVYVQPCPGKGVKEAVTVTRGGTPRPGLKVFPCAGRAIVFWSKCLNGKEDPHSVHSGEPVVQGEKWIATRWLKEAP